MKTKFKIIVLCFVMLFVNNVYSQTISNSTYSKDAFCALGSSFYDVYKHHDGELIDMGVDDKGRIQYMAPSKRIDESLHIGLVTYYYFVNERVIEYEVWVFCLDGYTNETIKRLKESYYEMKNSFLAKSSPETIIDLPGSDDFMLVYSYFTISFLDHVFIDGKEDPYFVLIYTFRK